MRDISERIYLRSFGCPTNLADGEFMAGCLSEFGYNMVKTVEEADIAIYNTCAVKTPTENRIMNILRRVPRNKKLIVTGCLPLINFERLKTEVVFDGVTGPSSADNIIKIVRRVSFGEQVMILGSNSKPSLGLPKIHTNPIIGIVPIGYGCLGACSYCCVQLARGRLRSYTIDEIVERVKRDLESGVREIWLTSQDTAGYGKDIGTSLTCLLEEICKIKRAFYVRVGMMNPKYASGILENLVHIYKNNKIFKFIHLPIQSGDNEILQLMNRFYVVEDFQKIVYQFRREIPKITLATDVICGFPGESEKAFNRTLKLVEDVKPDIVNISKFFPRPETPAKEMEPKRPPQEIRNRSRKMAHTCKSISIAKNRKWVNWAGKVLIDEQGKYPMSWIGRNYAYKPTVIKSNQPLLGSILKTRVVNAFSTHLEADVL